jgi:N6-adenosine-specific RNA methylase IME4
VKFQTAIVDPPWDYARTSSSDKLGGYSDKQYEPLTTAALAELPVGELVGGVLLLWATGPMMPSALALVDAWGFEFITLTYWLKTSPLGHPQETFDGRTTFKRHMGVGYWFRGDVEPVVVAKRKGTPSYRTGRRASFLRPAMRHSAKPDYLHELAEEFFPGPYLELFARRSRPGWTCLGDGIDGLDIREAMHIHTTKEDPCKDVA